MAVVIAGKSYSWNPFPQRATAAQRRDRIHLSDTLSLPHSCVTQINTQSKETASTRGNHHYKFKVIAHCIMNEIVWFI